MQRERERKKEIETEVDIRGWSRYFFKVNYLTWPFSNHWFLKFSGERKSLRDGKEADSKFKVGGYGKLKKWGGWALAAGSLIKKTKKKQKNTNK